MPEMQEDILSYGINQSLLDYLKETRAPKPIQEKRNKKILVYQENQWQFLIYKKKKVKGISFSGKI